MRADPMNPSGKSLAFALALLALGGISTPALHAAVNTGPDGGTVTALAIVPGAPPTVYAGTAGGGVYKSVDRAGHWTPASTGLTQPAVTALAVAPATASSPAALYAGTQDGIFKSIDGAATWASAGGVSSATGWVTALAVDAIVPETVWAGVSGSAVSGATRLQRSTDGGATWESMAFPPGFTSAPYSLAAAGPLVFVGTSLGLYKSTDGGATWTLLPAVQGWVRALLLRHGTVVNAGTSTGFYRSFDAGATWALSNGGMLDPDVAALAVDPHDSRRLYAGTLDQRSHGLSIYGGVFRSTDRGGSWTAVRQGMGRHSVAALAVDPSSSSILYAGTYASSVYRSVDGATTWSGASHGLRALRIASLAVSPTTGAVFLSTENGLFTSSDGGGHWRSLPTATTTGQVIVDSAGTIYAISYRGTVVRSRDGGATWDRFDVANTGAAALAVDPSDPAKLFVAGHYQDLAYSTNGGKSWKDTSFANMYPHALAVVPGGRTVYAAGDYGVLFSGGGVARSLDGGATWSLVGHGLPAAPLGFAVAVDPSDPQRIFAGISGALLVGSDFVPVRAGFRSTDGGGSWTLLPGLGNGGGDVTAFAFLSGASRFVYAGADGVFASTDAGETWRLVDGLGGRSVLSLVVAPSPGPAPLTLFAGTTGGLFRVTP